MKTLFHKSLTPEIWSQKPIEYQILTIGAEFGRAKSLLEKGYIPEMIHSLERIMELLDLTKYDPKWKNKLRELCRFREWIGELYISPKENSEICYHLYKCLLQWNPQTAMIEL